MAELHTLPTAPKSRSAPADLETRIADAFQSNPSSADIAALLAEVAEADQRAKDASEQANETALDPATRPDAVARARKAMEDADFTRRRMARASERLSDLLEEAKAREKRQADREEFEAARAERDALVEDLKEYPALIEKIAGLIIRVRDNDARVLNANRLCGSREDWLHSAERIFCGNPEMWSSDGTHDQPRLVHSRLVKLTQKGGRHINLRN
jgi:phosphatidate phosphatase PAH1